MMKRDTSRLLLTSKNAGGGVAKFLVCTAAVFALAIGVLVGGVSRTNLANAATDWMDPNAIYDRWNSAQYDPCTSFGSGSLDITDTEDSTSNLSFDMTINNIAPASCYYANVFIVNTLSEPVTVSYLGAGDDGTIADYLFQWLSETPNNPAPFTWTTVTLQPGESTPNFVINVGMPWDAPNAAAGTSGTFHYSWQIKSVAPTPPLATNDGSEDSAAADAISTPFETPIAIDVLANDTANGATLTEVSGSGGTWEIANGKILFTPAAGFTGVARATYKIANADGEATAEIIVIVAEPAIETPPPTPPILNPDTTLTPPNTGR